MSAYKNVMHSLHSPYNAKGFILQFVSLYKFFCQHMQPPDQYTWKASQFSIHQ
jgi:hypothetical protein